jgi:hypothetical protein
MTIMPERTQKLMTSVRTVTTVTEENDLELLALCSSPLFCQVGEKSDKIFVNRNVFRGTFTSCFFSPSYLEYHKMWFLLWLTDEVTFFDEGSKNFVACMLCFNHCNKMYSLLVHFPKCPSPWNNRLIIACYGISKERTLGYPCYKPELAMIPKTLRYPQQLRC